MIEVKGLSVLDIADAPNLAELLAEYGEESAIEGLGPPSAQIAIYHQLEQAGGLHLIGAFDGGVVIGFLILIVTVLPHYGALVATSESFFVAKASRKTGAGLLLLREAERMAKEKGAAGLLVSAPADSQLEAVLPRVGFRETNRVFFRGLK